VGVSCVNCFFFWQVRVHDADARHSDHGNKMVSEIYLTRLLATKVRFWILAKYFKSRNQAKQKWNFNHIRLNRYWHIYQPKEIVLINACDQMT